MEVLKEGEEDGSGVTVEGVDIDVDVAGGMQWAWAWEYTSASAGVYQRTATRSAQANRAYPTATSPRIHRFPYRFTHHAFQSVQAPGVFALCRP